MRVVIFTRRRALGLASGFSLALAACSPQTSSFSQAVFGGIPDATVELSEYQVAFLGSGDAGSGTLHYRGRSYPLQVVGVGVGGVGASRLEATGDVFNMTDINKFPGTYGRARAGFALGDISGGELWLENVNGVVIRLKAKREGLMLTLGGDAMEISFR